MKFVNQILDALFTAIKKSIEEFILPTGETLIPAIVISLIITGANLLGFILGWPTLLSLPGTFIGVGVLCIICFIERRERSEISNFYRAAIQGARRVAERAKGLASNKSVEVPESNTDSSSDGDGE